MSSHREQLILWSAQAYSEPVSFAHQCKQTPRLGLGSADVEWDFVDIITALGGRCRNQTSLVISAVHIWTSVLLAIEHGAALSLTRQQKLFCSYAATDAVGRYEFGQPARRSVSTGKARQGP